MLAHLASLVEQDPWSITWDDEDDEEVFEPPKALCDPAFKVSDSVKLKIKVECNG